MRGYQITISGKLNKTGFLFYVKQFAILNNIKGLVTYTKDSEVSIEAEGAETDLNKFIEYCRIGPNGAVIDFISITPVKIQHHKSFEIIENKISSTH